MFEFWQGDGHLTISNFIVRALVAYVFLFGIIKFIGQRTMSNLQSTDFLFAIVIGDVIGEPLINGDISLTGPFTVAVTLTLIHYFITFVSMKSAKIRRFVDEKPMVLVSRGKILRSMMKKTKITLDMLLMAMRMNNVSRMSDVQLAVLEPNGDISIITKEQAQSNNNSSKKDTSPEVMMPSVLIEDGNVIKSNLEKRNLDETWLKQQLKAQGVHDPNDVFLALLESGEQLYVSKKEEPYLH
ncbi:hypothetical protein BEP19_09660 [Ammoniphilus oxalaticus]|uniref:DUF421 domain-containing protein n=1 Tax=Ammoniphilus oxalaticus TaxID=66863 RepID=A0A419SKZ7_9BACL|nr:DUF421 domain-containing protein [Ammoniphilus oxalaticus]RKD24630.1 hypothetical protein BEP19_09660 [Ammoniphilus oxalaticus]